MAALMVRKGGILSWRKSLLSSGPN